MRKNEKRVLLMGSMLVVAFAVWTALIQIVDVQPVGQNGTSIGFSTFNCWFHNLTGVHMSSIRLPTGWVLYPYLYV